MLILDNCKTQICPVPIRNANVSSSVYSEGKYHFFQFIILRYDEVNNRSRNNRTGLILPSQFG